MQKQFSALHWLESIKANCETLGIPQQTIEHFEEHYLHIRLKGAIDLNDKSVKHFEKLGNTRS